MSLYAAASMNRLFPIPLSGPLYPCPCNSSCVGPGIYECPTSAVALYACFECYRARVGVFRRCCNYVIHIFERYREIYCCKSLSAGALCGRATTTPVLNQPVIIFFIPDSLGFVCVFAFVQLIVITN